MELTATIYCTVTDDLNVFKRRLDKFIVDKVINGY